ncbi:hypothetical protein ACFYVL_28400 [Streptomyces sp. NPDC004111]|uniref:hypothetical protein n=1 Tax=Streptomyces sp. NPDC004111 TaxID=3364690 RepID=UPI0036791D65
MRPMDITEIVVAVITTGPAYIAVWWAVYKDKHQQPAPVAQCAACGGHAADCARTGNRTGADSPGGMKVWALAA